MCCTAPMPMSAKQAWPSVRSGVVSPPHRLRQNRCRPQPLAARLPGVCGPFDVYLQAQRPTLELDLRLALARAGSTSPAPRRPRGFAPPRRFFPQPAARPCFMPVPSLGFHPFEGFSPIVAPETSRPRVSSLPFVRLRGRGFEDVSIDRMR